MFGFLGSSTDKLADQDVSPLSELAVQVYNAVSSGIKSIRKNTRLFFRKCILIIYKLYSLHPTKSNKGLTINN